MARSFVKCQFCSSRMRRVGKSKTHRFEFYYECPCGSKATVDINRNCFV